ncbi:hypothetical protein [Streptomyces celluloflavus]|uniref:Uncharacterized protein n=1 Tax=Streptomyces celluloflavus TaxID=58344 RepID=A0ABW7RKE9_9ACTN|nr:hypothetical protein OG717_06875 [Streptomyces celluloflavus]
MVDAGIAADADIPYGWWNSLNVVDPLNPPDSPNSLNAVDALNSPNPLNSLKSLNSPDTVGR